MGVLEAEVAVSEGGASGVPERTEYRSYLVRLWCEGQTAPWRAHLRSIATGEEHRFSSLRTLFAFLEEETGGSQPRQGPA